MATQTSGGGSFYHVPATVEDMKPPSPSSLITEAANFLRAHWDEVKPYYQSMSGETASIHGSFPLDEAACVFKIQQIASANGYAYLGTVQAAKLRRAFRFGFRRNTGEKAIMQRLAVQHKQRRIEDRQQQP